MNLRQALSAFRTAPLFHYVVGLFGLALVAHYRWVMDDAYVYFRYADNLVIYGSGLVNNAGEYVEGYSSPAWMLLIAAGRLVTGNYPVLVLTLGVAIYVIFWAGLVLLNHAVSPPDVPRHNLPLLYLLGNYAVLCYFTSGLETPLVQLAALGFAALAFFPRSRALQIALSFAPLVRPEFAVPLAIILLWVLLHDFRRGLVMAVIGFLINAAWLAFRIYYYADLFPNTFHLKNETNWVQGFAYLRDTAEVYLVLPCLIVMALLLAALRQVAPRSESLRLGPRAVILLCALSVTVYVMKIGGDPRHFRYLAFPFCLIAAGACGITEGVAQVADRIFTPRLRQALLARKVALVALGGGLVAFWVWTQSVLHAVKPWAPLAVVIPFYMGLVGLLHVVVPRRRVILPLLFLLVLTRFPWQLNRNPLLGRSTHMQIELINDASIHRDHSAYPWSRRAAINEARPGFRSFADYDGIAISGICGELYMYPHRWAINVYGLTDAFLGHSDVPSERPAHKAGLEVLAYDLQEIYLRIPPGPGVFARAAAMGIAPLWVTENLEPLARLERRVFNRHNFIENFRLAISPSPRIKPPASEIYGPSEGSIPQASSAPASSPSSPSPGAGS